MRAYKLYIFDLDGVLYRGEEPIEGAGQTVAALRKRRAKIRFLTNNSSLTREQYAQKLRRLGFEAVADEVYSSAFGAAKYISSRGGTTAYVVGEHGLKEEISSVGVNLKTKPEDSAEWVVVGITWHLNYEMLDEAQWRIRNGASFLATNTDATYPDSGDRLRPGAGAIVAAVATAAGRAPDVVIGKPGPILVEMIFGETGLPPAETLLVGDRVDTDIVCAQRAGCDSALVLTGVTQRDSQPLAVEPTLILDSVTELAGS